MPPRRRRRVVEVDKRDPFAELTRQIWAQPQVQAALESLKDVASGFADMLPEEIIEAAAAGATRAKMPKIRPPREPRPQPQPAPPPPPPAPPTMDARAVMHFGPAEPLTRQKIKERQRALARIAHSDVGGDKEAMQRINAAAAELLAGLR